MARPFKQGLDYFPLDLGILENEKLQELFDEFGYLGQIVYIRILILVYRNGYYLEVSSMGLAKIVYRFHRCPWLTRVESVLDVICRIAELGLLNKSLMSKGIITSESIQKQWLISTRKRKNVDKSKHWLLDSAKELKVKDFNDTCASLSTPDLVIDTDNNIIGVNNSVKKSDNSQKEKEKKKKKESDKRDKEDKGVYGYPKLHFITNCLIKNKYIEDSDLEIMKYNALAEELVIGYGFDNVLSATDYIVSYSKRYGVDIYDRFDFYKEAMINNCEMLRSRDERGGSIFGESIDEFLEGLLKKNSKT